MHCRVLGTHIDSLSSSIVALIKEYSANSKKEMNVVRLIAVSYKENCFERLMKTWLQRSSWHCESVLSVQLVGTE